jgi:hypothetical protein
MLTGAPGAGKTALFVDWSLMASVLVEDLSRQPARRRQLGVIKRVIGTCRCYLTRAGRTAIAAGRRLIEQTIIPALA